MNIATKTSALLISAIGLAGCDGPTDPFAFDTTYASFADISTALQPGIDTNVEADGDLIDFGDRAESADFDSLVGGSVVYDGGIVADEVGTGQKVMGQLQLEVDLDTNFIEGRAGNFIRSNEDMLLGTLLGNSTFSRDIDLDGNHFTMDLTGSLDDDGSVLDTTIALEGNFLNTSGDVTDIAGDADITMNGGPDFEEGAFSATR